DITNPRSPSYRALGPTDFISEGGGYRLVVNVDESLTARSFIALAGGGAERLAVRAVSVDAPSRLRETAGSYQALVISHRDFMTSSLADYVARRRSQGYRVLLADVEDVYDEFNGGLPHASAIKRYVKYGLDHWGVEYVLLVGDASEDHRRLVYRPAPDQGSGPDYVPSFTYSTSVSGSFDDEVIYSDKYYSYLDETVPVSSGMAGAPLLPGGYPDVFIGRLSVGNDIELRAVTNKINNMETPQPNDAWRRRLVLLSDDAWSGGGSDYRYRSYEYDFERSTDSCAAAVERALPGGFDVQNIRLSLYTDPIHPNRTESGPAVLSKSIAAARGFCTPAVNKALNRGCLWYMFQGHGNRAVLTTEAAYSLGFYMDPDSLRIYKPFIFVGIGCHISGFAIQGEYNYVEVGPNGDCMSEQLLFKSGAGAVATYASTGFEYLTQNAVLVEQLHRTIFQAPPADSVGPQNEYTGAHWIFGEAIAKAEIEQIDHTAYGTDQVFRYCILGDPMLKIDPGPPLMRLEADSAGEYRVVIPGDTMRARGGANLVKLRLMVSDIVAIGRITLRVNGEDSTGSLRITPLVDADKTYARSYQVDYDYTIDPNDDALLFQVFSPDGREVGRFDVPILTSVRLYSDGDYEIGAGVESPPAANFIVTADFPAYLPEAPVLSIDGISQEGSIVFSARDPNLPLRWKAQFHRTLTSGLHVFTVRAGDFSRDISFNVTGNDLVANAFSFPNPFRGETNIVYSLNLAVESVTIDIYNVSGVRIRSLDPPPSRLGPASFARPHSVLWDGRDLAGDRVANGTYIYVIHISRSGKTIDIKGKSVKLE
ncbi:MAG: C25 family cysteine peptidase, partial [Candidatus Krumholzibacteria bacterium]|nr:C25 family cysteine peptidase [Candidatus Krumholzibacteria bacterium]